MKQRAQGDTYSSARWRSRKKKVLQRNGGRCERCNLKPSYYAHHLSYPRCRLGDEPDEVLQAVCWECHAHYHPKRRRQYKRQWALRKPAAVWYTEAQDWQMLMKIRRTAALTG